jgi:hypothetical protein
LKYHDGSIQGSIDGNTIIRPTWIATKQSYDQIRMAYEAGAEYIVIFNYAEDMEGPYGTLQEEHFVALEHFWNEVV